MEDCILAVTALERHQALSSRTRTLSTRLGPLIKFVERYAIAVDAIVQFHSNPASLIWGLLRVLLEIAGSLFRFFEKLIAMLERIGSIVSIYTQYEEKMGSDERFKTALADVYFDILTFLRKAKRALQRRGITMLGRITWRNFESEFYETVDSLFRHTLILKDVATLTHRGQMYDSMEQQQKETALTREALGAIQDVLLPEIPSTPSTHTSRPYKWTQRGHLSNLQCMAPEAALSEKRRAILEWLSPLNCAEDLFRESQMRSLGTGDWLLNNAKFCTWIESSSDNVLWIFGAPGSGKTVLSTRIVDHIQSEVARAERRGLGYFLCDKSDVDKRSLLSMLASLTAQLLAQIDNVPEPLLSAFDAASKYGRSKVSMTDSPLTLFMKVTQILQKSYVVLDGLDESIEYSEMVRCLIAAASDADAKVSVVLISRDTPKIRDYLGKFATLELTAITMKSDIDTYLRQAAAELLFDDPAWKENIVQQLSRNADGMFLWAYMMLQSLQRATSIANIKTVLDNLPIGLDLTYCNILRSLCSETPERQTLIRKVLAWICCSSRPLAWSEMQHALAMAPGTEQFDSKMLPFMHSVLELCGHLIQCQSDTNVFRPAHTSVKEFLLLPPENHATMGPAQAFLVQEHVAHRQLGGVCLAYLSLPEIASKICVDASEWPLVGYATMFWWHHVLQSQYCSRMKDAIILFLSDSCRRQIWIARRLFLQNDTFPMQQLFKAQEDLKIWARPGITEQNKEAFDWTQDISQVLIDWDRIWGQYSYHADHVVSQKKQSVSHFERLMVIRDLAREYTRKGNLEQGAARLLEALKRRWIESGSDNRRAVWLLNSLGIMYDQQGKVDLSVSTQLDALRIQSSSLGDSHPETVWTINELGRVYRHQKRFQEAENMHLQALDSLRRTLPPDDPEIVWTVNTLARTYRKQGRIEEALRLHAQALNMQKKTLGSEHPHTLWTTSDIGRCYRDQGRLQEAADAHRTALEGRRRILGPEHLDTLWNMNDLGLVVAEMGDVEEAIQLQRTALESQLKALDPSHSYVLWTEKVLISLESRAESVPSSSESSQ